MRYEEFKSIMITKIEREAPEETSVEVRRVRKNNGIVMDGVSIREGNNPLAPVFYLDQYYLRFRHGEEIDDLVKEVLNNPYSSFGKEMDPEMLITPERIKERVRFKVINYDMNAALLKEIPFKKYLDLALVLYLPIEEEFIPNSFMTITNEHLEDMNLDKGELFKCAFRNTEKEAPRRITRLSDHIRPLPGIGEEEEEKKMNRIYVLSCRGNLFGASALFYPGSGEALKDLVKQDMILIPGSVNEWLIMRVSDAPDIDDINETIRAVNEIAVDADEVLSSHAYMLSAETLQLGYCAEM